MKIKKEEIMETLQKGISCEPDHDGKMVYYLHITEDGRIVNDHADADITCTAVLPEEAYEKYDEGYDWRDDIEVPSNPYFIAVTEELYEQANEELAKIEKFNITDEIEPQM